MKKILLIGLLSAAGAGAAFAQGQIVFANYSSSTQLTGVYWGNGPDAGAYVGSNQGAVITLLYGASTDTSISQLTGSYVTPINFGGTYSGLGPGQVSNGNEGQFTKYLLPTGVLSAGTTYAFAYEVTATLNGKTYIGYSTIWTQTTTASSTATPTTYIDNGNVAIVTPVPEPGTLALAGLGGFGMLMALRRKKA